MLKEKSYKAILLLILLVIGVSCNEDPGFYLPEPDAKIVVDGWIEEGDQAKVFLTANSPFTGIIDSASLRDLVLSRAKVSIDDGENSEVLILRKDERYFPPYYYAGNTIYGETGKTYTLTAEYGGKSVIAETSIPGSVPIDSVYFEPLPGKDSLGQIAIEFTDPGLEKNYYRIFTKRLGIDDRFIPVMIMAINDQFFNGQSVRFSMFRAPESYLDQTDDNYFRRGEAIVIKLSTMDRATFEFWSSYQDEILNSTNPFASSLYEVRSNIQGDGLGIWGGYAFEVDTVFTTAK